MTTGTRAVSLNNAVAIPTLAIGMFRVRDLTATEAARAVLAIGDHSVEPQRSTCRAYSFTKSRIDGLTPAGQATALVYATEAFEYEREIRPGPAISARSPQQFSTASEEASIRLATIPRRLRGRPR